jgi:hypothetical protein
MLYLRSPQTDATPRRRLTSPYLNLPLRSLERACRDLVGCAGTSPCRCATCRLSVDELGANATVSARAGR